MSNDLLESLPFRAEYAKSGRAACKSCKNKIEKDHLRIAAMVQSPMFDGKVPNWYHFACFFLKQRPKTEGDFSNFESLRWEDQKKIRKKLSEMPGTSLSSSSQSSNKAKRKSSASKSSSDFKIEYSVSSRATCRGCEEKIIKGEIRVAKTDYESEEGRQYGGIDRWHHLECFMKLRLTLEFLSCGSQLPGYKRLKQEDQIKVEQALPVIKSIKKEEPDVEPAKKPKLSHGIQKKQNELLYRYRDQLGTLPKKSLVQLLEFNKQLIPEGIDKMLDRLADAMAFGSLKPCTVCKKGQLVFRSGCGYFCISYVDEWAKCESTFDDPPRKPFIIPEELKENYEFLSRYTYTPGKRVFDKKTTPSDALDGACHTNALKSTKSDTNHSGPKVDRHLPLKRMEFVICGKLSRKNAEIKLEIMKLGGVLGSRIHDMTTALISSSETVKRNGSTIKAAETLNIQIVPECFLDECKNGNDPISCISRLNLVSWGSDPSTRLSAEAPIQKSIGLSKSKQYKSNAPTKIKLLVKDGIAVDPDSNLVDVAHVYRDHKNNVYNASLSLTDLQTGKNSYYKLQILESEKKNSYWLFRAWGRIGTTIGGNKTEKLSRDKAILSFKTLFQERTANSWDDRKHFIKVPGKMVMMDICYEDEGQMDVSNGIPSKLEKPVQELIQFIFNVNLMKNAMKEMEIDLEKMPLGKLSKKQIKEAFKVLTKLQNCLNKNRDQPDVKTIISYTNQFFTLIPHDFGTDTPPLLNDIEIVKQKTELLDSLLEIEIAYSLLKTSDEENENISPVDAHYLKLKTSLCVLSKSDAEYNIISQYARNTHAETHKNYELEILEVFKVCRHGEDERFGPFRSLHNRKLLWHGSRSTNFAGILSQGLRIAPPEAPVTGYMFGKGIYFADMVSKSANYCMTSPTNNTGLLLLCEVAMGNMLELYNAQNIVTLPKDKHSVKGVGKTHPDPQMTKILEDGVEIPLGIGVPSNHKETSLLYNEYIVYDVAQVKIKYLVQTKFDFTY